MAIKNIGKQRVYGFPTAIGVQFPDPIVTVRDPQVTDVGGAIGQEWVNTDTPAIFFLAGFDAGQAIWVNVHGGAGVFTSLTVNPGPINFTGVFTQTGTVNMNTTGAATTNIGNGGTGVVNIGNITGDTNVLSDLIVSENIFTLNGAIVASDTTVGAVNPAVFQMTKSRAGGVVVSGDQLGTILFTGNDGTTQITAAAITSTSTGTVAANRVASTLGFWTHPNSTGANALRMTVSSAGNVVINAPDSGVGLTVTAGGTTVTLGDVTLTNGNVVLSTAATKLILPGPVDIKSGAGVPANGLALHAGDFYTNTTPTGATDRLFVATGVGTWTNVTCAA